MLKRGHLILRFHTGYLTTAPGHDRPELHVKTEKIERQMVSLML